MMGTIALSKLLHLVLRLGMSYGMNVWAKGLIWYVMS